MSHVRSRVTRALMAGALTGALATTGFVTAAHAEPAGTAADLPSADSFAAATGRGGGVDVSGLVGLEGPTEVFVQLASTPVLEALDASGARSAQAQDDVAADAAAQVEADADTVVAALGDADVLYTTTNGVAGVAVRADAEALRDLAARDDVVAILPIVPKTPASNSGTDIFTGAADSWEFAGVTGEDTTIAVIDTGIDYTHASFGDSALTYPTSADGFDDDVAWPQGKITDGWDFVGHAYNGGYSDDPAVPDSNPIDESAALCTPPEGVPPGSGHGSHVAGTAAGYGVDAEGETFAGDYAALTDDELNTFQVGPGSAPEADLVALKVFGCAGSTAYVGAALDWLLAPDAPEVDVVNLSVGSEFSLVDDPENLLIDALVAAGIVVVTSAGNSGDVYDVGGSPGNANGSLAVANSLGNTFLFEGVEAYVDGATEPLVLPGQYSVNFTGTYPPDPIEVVTLTPGTLPYNSGCEPFTADDAARVAGKVVTLAWDNSVALPCGSAARFTNASNAGAAGVVLTSTDEAFEAGIAGNAVIPGIQLTGPATDELFAFDPATGVVDILSETLSVRFDPSLSVTAPAPSVADTLNASSSRGVHGSRGIVKPDVAAPGTSISSVAVGTGNGASVKSGTSMASPHVAGIAALTVQAHPDWSALQVKTAVINTANHDVRLGETPFGPQRVGTGRVDALQATLDTVLAYDAENPLGVSANFGVVEVGADAVSLTRTVEVANHGTADVTLGASYRPQSPVAGVEYTLSASEVSVPAGGTASVDVTLTVADPAALAKDIDPTVSAVDATYGLPREFLSTATGWLELTGAPNVEGPLRVSVSAAVKPVADIAGGDVVFGDEAATTTTLPLTGRGLAQDGYTSAVVPLELAATSEQIPADELQNPSAAGADLAAVGTAPFTFTDSGGVDHGYVGFGIATHAPWTTLGRATSFAVEVDTGDNAGPYTVEVQKLTDSVGDPHDITIVAVFDAAGTNTGLEFLNNVLGDTDTNTFDTSVAYLPVELAALGFTPEQVAADEVAFSYSVSGLSWYAEPPSEDQGLVLDTIEGLSYDAADTLEFGDGTSPLYVAQPDTGITVSRPGNPDAPPFPAAASDVTPTDDSVLLLNLHNAVGAQFQVIPVEQVTEPEPPAGVSLETTTRPGCLAGFAYVLVKVTNTDEVTARVSIDTPFLDVTYPRVRPDRSVYDVVTTFQRSIAPGTVTVTGTATVDGEVRESVYDVAYEGITCQRGSWSIS
ncbi:peptidase S8 and S53 subtilisin kexin sedolisin [Beutenbergia cavernae DSM 12333]|uniref:Peptidase S8 and S53 subtilisin kexin sedolisin n=1 Tax=Beutenbergia cavernae (strain ATCC BAA-8 / DSM 12333 / CCUG 43141 / JCM 11478 / NBRC 16432 / NCIMB 13614 / HKI 0122) TaxID=471853 RepID=C5BZI7_BEUC1|nr:S8 family serine peptidase [Beutenbergia cavernae]ACQ79159.1 peptidase S8 and S53 subtilisin kexin sedolisin [Beutenbergia cavernae DSM 12333]